MSEDSLLSTILSQKTENSSDIILIESVFAIILVILAVILPQIVRLIAGYNSGIKWMPIFLPVLLAGCTLGYIFGIIVGIVSPILSFIFTSTLKRPMPAKHRLGFMMPELAVFGFVSGLFSKYIVIDKLFAFPAVLFAQFAGLSFYMIINVLFQSCSQVSPGQIWIQIQTGMIGNFIQSLIVPLIVIGISKYIK